MVTAEKKLLNKVARQARVCKYGFDKALQLMNNIEYFSENKALVNELKSQLSEVQALNQAKDALLIQYTKELRVFNKDRFLPLPKPTK